MTFQQYPQKLGIPSGNTAARPSSPIIGDTYYNGELSLLEIYDGTNWVPSSAPAGIPTVATTDVGTGRAYGSGAINFSFTAGINGGTPYGYNGVAILGGTTYTTGNTTATTATLVVGISGSYSVSGSSYNGFGASPGSVPGTLAVTTVPEAPTIGTATASGATAIITWTLNSNGGKNLSAITVTPYLNGTTAGTSQNAATTSSTSMTFTGLVEGSSYTFKVKTTNANGNSLESSATNSIAIPVTLDYLIVAGGGGGGRSSGGGGGAGGYLTTIGATAAGFLTGTNYSVTVGAGGTSQQSGSLPTAGGNSVFTTVTSYGGGGGGGYNFNASPTNTFFGLAGGSGGGAWGASPTTGGAASPSGQGNAGGTAGTGSGYGESTGGGGGAGAAGGNGGTSNGICGAGGVGLSNSITGSAVFYAGGGGGGYGNYNYGGSQTGGAGGNGGGGQGANNSGAGGGLIGTNGGAGTANTGGGGGGSSYVGQLSTPGAGGNGGSGVVILRYPDNFTITIGAGLTGTTSSASGGYKRTTLTAGSGNVSWT